jgi:putative phosphoribosyl transferase
MPQVRIDRLVDRPIPAFLDREAAGRRLAGFFQKTADGNSVVLCLPRGGVPVGGPVAEVLEAPLSVAVARKLPVPHSPEMGFGAVCIDGSVALNERLVDRMGIDQEEIDRTIEEVSAEVKRRAAAYTGSEEPPDVKNRDVFLVDDGIATGYTMMAAAKMLRKQSPGSLILGIPAAHKPSLDEVQELFDEAFCLFAQELLPFAVASFYERFEEMTDEDVHSLLEKYNRGR